jgi:protein-S-isoprenylcysteine O-methyltransferase Ste14
MAMLVAAGKAAAGLLSASVQRLVEDAMREFAMEKVQITAALVALAIILSGLGVSSYAAIAAFSAPPPSLEGGCHNLAAEPSNAETATEHR